MATAEAQRWRAGDGSRRDKAVSAFGLRHRLISDAVLSNKARTPISYLPGED
jgi:hypothetical protein